MRLRSTGIRIVGSGSAVSRSSVSNQELRPETADWVKARLGIKERRHLQADETLMSLVESASKKALQVSGLKAQDLDGIIIATSTPDFINPSMAAILHGRLGARPECASFDLQAVCAGFNTAPSECSQTLSSASPQPGFGTATTTGTTGSAGAAAQCG